MMDYLVGALEGSDPRITPVKGGLGGLANCIEIGDNSAVLLIDKTFPGDSWRNLMNAARTQYDHTSIVFYKDGETFFRNAAKKNHFKTNNRSLKHYTTEDMQKMIALRPEERDTNWDRSWVEYFQPESARLNEGVIAYQFANVEFDYSHITDDRFKPANTVSQRLFLVDDKVEHFSKLKFNPGFRGDGEGYLVDRRIESEEPLEIQTNLF